jgi:hypothetical protein
MTCRKLYEEASMERGFISPDNLLDPDTYPGTLKYLFTTAPLFSKNTYLLSHKETDRNPVCANLIRPYQWFNRI